jgi:hypothetical protein
MLRLMVSRVFPFAVRAEPLESIAPMGSRERKEQQKAGQSTDDARCTFSLENSSCNPIGMSLGCSAGIYSPGQL